MSTSNRSDFLLGLLVGAAAGAAAALLYAPAPGNETRDQVKSVAEDAVGRAGEVASTVRERATELTSKAGEVASTVKEKAGGVASTVKEKAADVASKVKTQAQDMASHSQDVMKDVSQRGAGLADNLSDVKDQAVNAVQGAVSQASEAIGGQKAGSGDDWPSQLPESLSTENHKLDQHTFQTSDDPDVVAERVNAAMQGSGEEAEEISEELAKAPTGGRSES